MSDAARAILWPTFFAAPALLVLLGLGTWQMQRLAWKDGLLADIAYKTAAEPVDAREVLGRMLRGEAVDYVRVTVSGQYDHAREMHLYQILGGRPGWHVYTPLRTDDGRTLVVNRGFVPLELKKGGARPASLVEGRVSVTGLVRSSERSNVFTPDNAPEKNEWYWRDISAMNRRLAPDAIANAYPFSVDAEAGGDPGDLPIDGTTIVRLPNNHFGYALTWFGLAGTLVLVYVPFVVGRLRGVEKRGT